MSDTKQRGRAVNPNSKRQQKLASLALNGPSPRGRAVDPNSKRQQILADRAANGLKQRGRPKKTA